MGNVCFGSATARFTATVDNGSCAPGQYEPRALPKQGGLSLTTVPRLPKPSSAADASGGVVGPGMYPLKDLWMRKSYNTHPGWKPPTSPPSVASHRKSVGERPASTTPQKPQRS